MAKHFTWCLRRTILLTTRSNVHQQFVPTPKAANVAIQTRFIANPRQIVDPHVNADYDEVKDFREFAEEYKSSEAIAAATLMKILSVARANAKKAVDDYPNFKVMPQKMIFKNFQILRERGFYKSTIKDNKYLLTYDTDTLKKKINIIQKIGLDVNDTAALFQLPVLELSLFEARMKIDASYLPARNRIVYLAEKLQSDVPTICVMLSYNLGVLKIPAPKLLTITEYLLEAGMTPQHILNDVQVYNYNIGTIKEKIERAQRAEIKPLKPWVVRCPESIWKKHEEYRAEQQLHIKPGLSLAEHIRDVFDCDMNVVNYLMQKNPRVSRMNVVKLVKIAKLLREEGYKLEDVQRSPGILQRDLTILHDRFAAWKKLSKQRPPLSAFVLKPEKFEKLLKSLRSCDKNEKPS